MEASSTGGKDKRLRCRPLQHPFDMRREQRSSDARAGQEVHQNVPVYKFHTDPNRHAKKVAPSARNNGGRVRLASVRSSSHDSASGCSSGGGKESLNGSDSDELSATGGSGKASTPAEPPLLPWLKWTVSSDGTVDVATPNEQDDHEVHCWRMELQRLLKLNADLTARQTTEFERRSDISANILENDRRKQQLLQELSVLEGHAEPGSSEERLRAQTAVKQDPSSDALISFLDGLATKSISISHAQR